MKIIDTSKVSATAGYPGIANVNNASIGNGGNPGSFVGLDFLQSAVMDVGNAIMSSLVWVTNTPIILSGCVLSGSSLSAGWVWYITSASGAVGEIFYVPAQTISGSGAYLNGYIQPDPNDNGTNAPVTTLSDGSTQSMHNKRTILMQYGSSAAGDLPNFGGWDYTKTYNSAWTAIAGGVGYQNSWSDQGSPYNNGRYRRLGRLVYLSGAVKNSSANFGTVAFQLPYIFAPVNTVVLSVPVVGGAFGDTLNITITSNGNVTIGYNAISPSDTYIMSLDGVCFPID